MKNKIGSSFHFLIYALLFYTVQSLAQSQTEESFLVVQNASEANNKQKQNQTFTQQTAPYLKENITEEADSYTKKDLNRQEESGDMESLQPLSYTNSDSFEAFWKVVFKTKYFYDRSGSDTALSTEHYGELKWQVLDSVSFNNQALLIGRSGFYPVYS